jgi:hypothetical protein
MRCPSCGTENAPDSRFCGGCGARLGTSGIAPTQKISDDASYPQRPAMAPVARHAHAAAAIPPTPSVYTPGGPSHARAPRSPSATRPPTAPLPPNAAPTPPPNAYLPSPAAPDEPSLSMPIVARRPWGLIIAVLLIDLALAVSGAWMLTEGIGAPPQSSESK